MSTGRMERILLNSNDLKELYRVTNPKLNSRLRMVILTEKGGWTIESDHPLRGYRACKANLAARVRQYEEKKLWPNKCGIGIGIFESDKLVRVLVAEHRGYKEAKEEPSILPTDAVLMSLGLTRKDLPEHFED